MDTLDTLDLGTIPFYLWDSVIAAQPQEAEFAGVEMMDSVFCTRAATDSVMRPSLFEGHSLAPSHPSLQPRMVDTAPAWVFVLLLSLVALLTLYYRTRKLRIADLAASLVSVRTMDRTLRNNNMIHTRQLAWIAPLLTGCLSLAVHQAAMTHTGLLGFLLLWAALTLAYYLRNGVARLLGMVFDSSDAVNIYITSNYLFHLALPTLLVPLLFPFVYLPWGHEVFTYLIAGITAFELIVRLFRSLQLFLTNSVGSRFYLFYYLCTVELVPILVLAKWIIE